VSRIGSFQLRSETRQPWEAALEWILAHDAQPGDEISQSEMTHALGMVDLDQVSPEHIARWNSARSAQIRLLALAYQERTGRIIDLGCSGNYRIYPPPKEIVAALKSRLRRYLKMIL
jgi:hypothetical protein